MDLIVRPAETRDINALCDFELKARATEPGVLYFDCDPVLYSKQLREIDLENTLNTKIIVAIYNGEIIGRCDIQIMHSLVNFEKIGYVDWIYTLIDFRYKNVAHEMLRGAEDYFKSQKVCEYFVFTASNEDAQRFYKGTTNFQIETREVATKEL